MEKGTEVFKDAPEMLGIVTSTVTLSGPEGNEGFHLQHRHSQSLHDNSGHAHRQLWQVCCPSHRN